MTYQFTTAQLVGLIEAAVLTGYDFSGSELEVFPWAQEYAKARVEELTPDAPGIHEAKPEGATLLERVAALEKWREERERELDDEAYHAMGEDL